MLVPVLCPVLENFASPRASLVGGQPGEKRDERSRDASRGVSHTASTGARPCQTAGKSEFHVFRLLNYNMKPLCQEFIREECVNIWKSALSYEQTDIAELLSIRMESTRKSGREARREVGRRGMVPAVATPGVAFSRSRRAAGRRAAAPNPAPEPRRQPRRVRPVPQVSIEFRPSFLISILSSTQAPESQAKLRQSFDPPKW